MFYGKFQSTPPVWVVTVVLLLTHQSQTISIHTTRVGGDSVPLARAVASLRISIHTTRVGGDLHCFCSKQSSNISIHTTRVGGDIMAEKTVRQIYLFQSTPPVWVVTLLFVNTLFQLFYFNPHHPCGW